MVILHSAAVLSAALPVAVASLLIDRNRAVLIGTLAGASAVVIALLLSLTPAIWPVIWNSHPVFFITDQIKLIVAVPFVAWIIRSAFNNRLDRTRGRLL
jgi:hypothetical protein